MSSVQARSPYAGFRCAVGAFFFVQGLVFASWASRIPDIKRFLDLNEAELGGVLFAMPCGQMAAMALSGYLVGKFGSRRMLMLAAMLYPILLVGLGLAGTVLSLCVLLFGFGVAANVHNIAVNTQAVGVEKLYQRSIMATFHGLWSFAGLVGGIVGALCAGLSLSPFVHFLGILGIVLVVFGVLHRNLLPQDAVAVPKEGAEAKTFVPGGRLFDPTVLLIGIIAFGCMASEGVMYDWSSVYFETVVQAEPQWIRLGYIAFMCLMVCGRFLADGLITRFGVIRLLRGSGLLIAGGFFCTAAFPSLASAALGMALVGLGTAAVVPICYSLAGQSRTIRPGTAIALVSSIGFLGFLLCPPLIGSLAYLFGLRATFSGMIAAGLLTAGLATFLQRR